MFRPLAHTLVVALAQAVVPAAPAAESVATYEHMSHLLGNRWVLWSRYGDKRAALLDTDTGTLRELPVDGWKWPIYFAPVAEGKRRWWLYGLDNTGDEWILGRTDLEGGGNPEIIRRFPKEGVGHPGMWLRPGPDGSLLMAVQREEGWMVDEFDPLSGAVRGQIGPLDKEPRFVTAWDHGRWLVVDGHRLWSWPDGETLRYDPLGAPRFWEQPPPVLPWGLPDWVEPRPEGGMFIGSWQYLAEIDGEDESLINAFHGGFLYPADGPADTAALEYPDDLVCVEDRTFLWEKGGQRLLRLERNDETHEWDLRTMWTRPVGAPGAGTGPELLEQALGKQPGQHWLVDYRSALDRLDEITAANPDPAPLQEVTSKYWTHYGAKVLAFNVLTRTGHEPDLWQPDPPPTTVDGVLEQFAATPFVDVEDISILSFLTTHRQEMSILESRRDEAVPRLLEQRSGAAAYALALLGAEEADAWYRELVLDPTERGWESGCTYPQASVGLRALQHLHQKPARELLRISPAQRKRYRGLAAANEKLEGMDRTCGDGGHAAMILSILESKED